MLKSTFLLLSKSSMKYYGYTTGFHTSTGGLRGRVLSVLRHKVIIRDLAGRRFESTSASKDEPRMLCLVTWAPHAFDESLDYYSAEDTPHEPSSFVFTSMPRPNDPHSVTQCLMSSGLKSYLFTLPDFPHSPPTVGSDLLYYIGHTEAKGRGLFADRPIEVGDLIVAERPLLLLSIWADIIRSSTSHVSDDNFSTLLRKIMDCLFRRMTPENQASYLELSNSYPSHPSGILIGILRTNKHVLQMLDPECDRMLLFNAVGNILSRINHSCRPNALITFHPRLFSLSLRAVRPIAKDEEISVSYTEIEMTAEDRDKVIEKYRIPACTCKSCVGPDVVASDKFRMEIQGRASVLHLQAEILRSPRAFGSLITRNSEDDITDLSKRIFDESRALKKEIEEMGLEACRSYYVIVAAYFVAALFRKAKDPSFGIDELLKIRRETERVQKDNGQFEKLVKDIFDIKETDLHY
ncbi:hypothetical protein BDQ17DRAFT_1518999 [Cyathus striatus]|nr:hypothetical protein BDQ17DRAFT_1518999 [Cyathus striatus]